MSVNEFSFGTLDHYSRVISISRTQQGRKVEIGIAEGLFLRSHEFWLQVHNPWLEWRWWDHFQWGCDRCLFDAQWFQCDKVCQWFSISLEATIKRLFSFRLERVDWSRGAQTLNYVRARNRVGPTGKVLARFIDFLHENNALKFEELTVAGFSLGGEFDLESYFALSQLECNFSSHRWNCWKESSTRKDWNNHRTRSSWSAFYHQRRWRTLGLLRRNIRRGNSHQRSCHRHRLSNRSRWLLPQRRNDPTWLSHQLLPPRQSSKVLHRIYQQKQLLRESLREFLRRRSTLLLRPARDNGRWTFKCCQKRARHFSSNDKSLVAIRSR